MRLDTMESICMESPITTGRAYALPSFWLMKASGSPMRPVAHGVALAEIHAVQELGSLAPEFHGGSITGPSGLSV